MSARDDIISMLDHAYQGRIRQVRRLCDAHSRRLSSRSPA